MKKKEIKSDFRSLVRSFFFCNGLLLWILFQSITLTYISLHHSQEYMHRKCKVNGNGNWHVPVFQMVMTVCIVCVCTFYKRMSCFSYFSNKNKFQWSLNTDMESATILCHNISYRLFDCLCWSLTTCQTLWAILCRLLEKGRIEIEEILEEIKERDRTGIKVKKQNKLKHSPLYS